MRQCAFNGLSVQPGDVGDRCQQKDNLGSLIGTFKLELIYFCFFLDHWTMILNSSRHKSFVDPGTVQSKCLRSR